jgi:hypothetical protein
MTTSFQIGESNLQRLKAMALDGINEIAYVTYPEGRGIVGPTIIGQDQVEEEFDLLGYDCVGIRQGIANDLRSRGLIRLCISPGSIEDSTGSSEVAVARFVKREEY